MWTGRRNAAWRHWEEYCYERRKALNLLARVARRWQQMELLSHALRWRDTCGRMRANRAKLRMVLLGWQRRELRLGFAALRAGASRRKSRTRKTEVARSAAGKWRLRGLLWSCTHAKGL